MSPLAHPYAQGVTMALLHFLWQGFVVAALYRIVVSLPCCRTMSVRYAAGLVSMLVMVLCPIVTLLVVDLGRDGGAIIEHMDHANALTAVIAPASADIGSPKPRRGEAEATRTDATDARTVSADSPGKASPTLSDRANGILFLRWSGSLPHVLNRIQPTILAVWLGGVLCMAARLMAGFGFTLWLRTSADVVSDELQRRVAWLGERMGVSARGRIFQSHLMRQAGAVALFRPIVLLPASWLTELPPASLEAIIAHELAHIRRWDLWANALQRSVETLLFYHPAVWWISRCVHHDRELCCDRLAVAATGQPLVYAQALNQAARLRTRYATPALVAPFLGERTMNLLNRIRYLLDSDARPQTGRRGAVAVLTLLVPLLFWGGMTTMSPVLNAEAQAQEREGDGPRRSPEAEAGPRRSPEAEAGRRRSAEGDAPRRSAEAEAGGRRSSEEGRGGGTALGRFRPQTEREAALYQMILQLQRDVAALRNELRSRGDASRIGSGQRDGDRRSPERRRDGDAAAARGPRDGRPTQLSRDEAQQARIFKNIDKNRDGTVDPTEFNRLFEGADDPAVQARNRANFQTADRDKDGKLSAAEFSDWRLAGRRKTEDGRPSVEGRRDGDAPTSRGPRDGEGPAKRRPRDGD